MINLWYRLLYFFGYNEYEKLGGQQRSNLWSSTRNAFIKEHPLCEVCGRRGTLLKPNEVHHVIPFWKDPSKENDLNNLMTGCRPHHLLVYHLMSWKSYNVDARADASIWRQKILNRPVTVIKVGSDNKDLYINS